MSLSAHLIPSIRSHECVVNPEIALSYLKANSSNRPFNRRLAERYAETMRRGAWLMNGEAIIVSSSGRLLDGQHRLHAVMMAGTSVPMLIISGVQNEEQAFNSLNSGRRRSNADRLSGRGEKYYALLASSITWLYRYQYGVTTAKATRGVDPDVQSALLEKHGGIRDWLEPGDKLRRAVGFQGSIMVFLLYAASRRYPESAMTFYTQCLEGINLTKANPAYLLRGRIVQRSGIIRIHSAVLLALCIKAWNAHANHEVLGNLRYAPATEDFPEIAGFPPTDV